MAFGSILDWGAESITVSIFGPEIPKDKHISQLFEAAYGEPSTQTSEAVQPVGRVGQATSNSNGVMKILSVQPGRLDFAAQGVDLSFSATAAPPTLVNIQDIIQDVVTAAKAITPSIPQIARLAVNCRIVSHQRSLTDANRQILSVFPYKIPLDNEGDFLFQVNNPAKVGGFNINRLVRWSVENIQMITAGAFGGVGMPGQQFMNQFYSAFVHLDFNTVPTHLMLANAQVPDMLDALSAEVVRVRKNSLRFK